MVGEGRGQLLKGMFYSAKIIQVVERKCVVSVMNVLVLATERGVVLQNIKIPITHITFDISTHFYAFIRMIFDNDTFGSDSRQ